MPTQQYIVTHCLPHRKALVKLHMFNPKVMSSKISRYTTPRGPESEFTPGSRGRILRNLQGITRKTEMDRIEYEALVQVQEIYLNTITEETRLTAAMICQMHRDWLGRIYAWAGQYRTVELQKGSFRWPPAYRVAENMATFERELLARHTPCPHEPLAKTARRIAEVHAELLLIHPFREGNGRLARWLADLMSLQAGYPLPKYEFAGKGAKTYQKRYLTAVLSGYSQDYEPLTAFFSEAITRRLEEPDR